MTLWKPKHFGISKLAPCSSFSRQRPNRMRINRTEIFMSANAPRYRAHAAVAVALVVSSVIMARANDQDGIVRIRSAYALDETISRIKKDIADKGIRFFSEIDQSKLAADAGIKLRPSTLLVFGNPPLGTQFITSNPNAGLDWPVRLLVTQEDDGSVWTVYSDFGWIARRHGIKNRDAQFKMASQVIASITSSVAARK
jgi:uncharacterized protein (DUF302 family)